MQEALKDIPLVVWDTETTGFIPGKDRVVEIGAIRRDPDGTITEFGQLINPEMGMPKEAGEVNGIKDEMLFDMPKVASVLPGFIKFIEGAILVGHNAPFDVNMIAAELQRSDMEIPLNAVYDTMLLARGVMPGFMNYKLQNLVIQLNLEKKGDAHRAIADCHSTLQLFDKCVEKLSPAPQLFHLHQYLAHPNFLHHGKRLFEDPTNARRFNMSTETFSFLKERIGDYAEVKAPMEKSGKVVRIIGVTTDGGYYNKGPAAHVMTRDQKGEYRSYRSHQVTLTKPEQVQESLFQ